MDLDAFVGRQSGQWRRLDELARRRRLSGAEADELVALYQRAATDLAVVQSRAPDPITTARLSASVGRGRAAVVGGTARRGWAALAHGVLVDFPVAVYLAWRWWLGVMVGSFAVAGAMMWYLADHPQRIARLVTSSSVKQLVNHDFAGYYKAAPAQDFAAHVWTNNALVAAESMLLGITIVGTVYFLLVNILNLGLVGGAMIGAGRSGLFWGLILPHGMLELTAVFVASGVGLRLGWSWIAPGPLPRSRSLAQAGRAAVVVSLGLVGVLLLSGVIEAYVTPSGLPTAARIGIGALAEAAFLSYVIVLGRRGVRAGETGDLAFDERESVAPVG